MSEVVGSDKLFSFHTRGLPGDRCLQCFPSCSHPAHGPFSTPVQYPADIASRSQSAFLRQHRRGGFRSRPTQVSRLFYGAPLPRRYILVYVVASFCATEGTPVETQAPARTHARITQARPPSHAPRIGSSRWVGAVRGNVLEICGRGPNTDRDRGSRERGRCFVCLNRDARPQKDIYIYTRILYSVRMCVHVQYDTHRS
ncbi:hypothetical protein B0T24DRAFT_187505 [Lasiosphaeria ovina]|uniref:Uncharacterized protein n=1 Tax=Lasiosphaeria ovina TaxID=92902 RepID=A0AAE0NEY6_9PEZI|nr:hypothetical protein B0T24DRAFT_187505 [Lasiosphaeria ovina]